MCERQVETLGAPGARIKRATTRKHRNRAIVVIIASVSYSTAGELDSTLAKALDVAKKICVVYSARVRFLFFVCVIAVHVDDSRKRRSRRSDVETHNDYETVRACKQSSQNHFTDTTRRFETSDSVCIQCVLIVRFDLIN